MFVSFLYTLRQAGIPVTPTSFLRLQKALSSGLVTCLEDFYVAARTILVKSERHFDLYDRLFVHHFQDGPLPELSFGPLDAALDDVLVEWTQCSGDPAGVAEGRAKQARRAALGQPMFSLPGGFQEEDEPCHTDAAWIGGPRRRPACDSGPGPGALRVGGVSVNKSALKVAMERRYRDYERGGPLTRPQVGEALKRLRHMVPVGPNDVLNVDETIKTTVRNAGDIEIIFDRGRRDRLQVILLIDNGGWSMDPHVELVQTLFDYARNEFKELKTYYFHNTVYSLLWKDPSRTHRPFRFRDVLREDPETRLIVVADASMGPYELTAPDGSIYLDETASQPSITRLRLLARTFRHAAWLNPVPRSQWDSVQTIGMIREIFPMFELTLDGLEQAAAYLTKPVGIRRDVRENPI